MAIEIIGVPLYYGCDRKGTELGPDKLREKNLIEAIIQHGHEVKDKGNIPLAHLLSKDKYKDHPRIKYLNAIIKASNYLADEVHHSLKQKHFPLVLGGDHALSLGSMAGLSYIYKNIAVIWVDAHGDINTPETSPSGNAHGMVLGAALGVGNNSMRNVYFKGIKVQPENVFILGARDLDQGEITLIEEKKIKIYSMKQIKKQGLENVLKSIVKEIKTKKITAIHLSYDLDVMEANLVPGTGLPLTDGLSVEQMKKILKWLFATQIVRSMDIVEFNPLLDHKDQTAQLILELVDYMADLVPGVGSSVG